MVCRVSPEDHERRRAAVAEGLPVGACWKSMAQKAGCTREVLRHYTRKHFPDLLAPGTRKKYPSKGTRTTGAGKWWDSYNRGTLSLYAAARHLLIEMQEQGRDPVEIALAVQKVQRECRKAARSAPPKRKERPKTGARAPSVRDGMPATFAMRRCLGCGMEFESEWIGHRLCHSCKGFASRCGALNEGTTGGRVKAIR